LNIARLWFNKQRVQCLGLIRNCWIRLLGQFLAYTFTVSPYNSSKDCIGPWFNKLVDRNAEVNSMTSTFELVVAIQSNSAHCKVGRLHWNCSCTYYLLQTSVCEQLRAKNYMWIDSESPTCSRGTSEKSKAEKNLPLDRNRGQMVRLVRDQILTGSCYLKGKFPKSRRAYLLAMPRRGQTGTAMRARCGASAAFLSTAWPQWTTGRIRHHPPDQATVIESLEKAAPGFGRKQVGDRRTA
jgi:hypothetical protein